MSNKKNITKIFANLRNEPTWRAWRGLGCSIFLEFGKPTVEYIKAIPASNLKSLRTPGVSLSGEFNIHLASHWQIYENEVKVTGALMKKSEIDKALLLVEGRSLLKIIISSQFGKTDFIFDYGMKITTSPYLVDIKSSIPEWVKEGEKNNFWTDPYECWSISCKNENESFSLDMFDNGLFNYFQSVKGEDKEIQFKIPEELIVSIE